SRSNRLKTSAAQRKSCNEVAPFSSNPTTQFPDKTCLWLESKAMAQRPIYTARLTHTELLSGRADCKHFEFEVEDLPNFEFEAGQFVSMLATNNDKTMTRAYSLASGPRGNNRFDLCLNRVEGGFFSNYLCDMQH